MSYDPRVLEVLAEAEQRAADEAIEQVNTIFGVGVTHGVESPIEQLFLAAFAPVIEMNPLSYILTAQVNVGKYRVDFIVTFNIGAGYDPIEVVVECDGHDFHEKTKDQAEHDKKRDRYLTSRGLTVMRFTGRELWRDPFACVEEVVDLTQGVLMDRQQEAYRRRAEAAKKAAGDTGEVPW